MTAVIGSSLLNMPKCPHILCNLITALSKVFIWYFSFNAENLLKLGMAISERGDNKCLFYFYILKRHFRLSYFRFYFARFIILMWLFCYGRPSIFARFPKFRATWKWEKKLNSKSSPPQKLTLNAVEYICRCFTWNPLPWTGIKPCKRWKER